MKFRGRVENARIEHVDRDRAPGYMGRQRVIDRQVRFEIIVDEPDVREALLILAEGDGLVIEAAREQ